MKRYLVHLFWLLPFIGAAQQHNDKDAFFIREIHRQALVHGEAMQQLTILSEQIGGRLAGSEQSAKAVAHCADYLKSLGVDTVYLQPCEVPRWERGEPETVEITVLGQSETLPLHALALGNSIGTGPTGLMAEAVEVKTLDEVDSLGEQLRGKIVFFNERMDDGELNTFSAYGKAAGSRVRGASRAARYGAVGVLVRSLTTQIDEVPHTGTLVYEEGIPRIPAMAISTMDAEKLSDLLESRTVQVFMRSTCQILESAISHNVVAEIKGTAYPEDIILVGGHLDSWDVGGGAHDDGAGCVHAMEVMRLIKAMNYQPKRSIRCVLFMNEENGLGGGKAYQAASFAAGEYHMAAIESDRGGFTPRGFTVEGHESVLKNKFRKLSDWLPLLEPYGLGFRLGGSGADISGLKNQKGLLIGFEPDTQRYFDYHHTAIDRIEAVNERELELGAAAMMSLVYLLDQYGLGE
ncbi:MAG TPA: M28 family peptidase [Saprospiraceae bacterium]|nr:M28 family peptidase [Saprospiraceae bacterium]HMQ82856.1 M28 family peptidase [Saprospiraceae bacterium]